MNTKLKQNTKKNIFFQINEQCGFWKNYGECKKT